MNRLYRALLRLYPASFRRDYGDEITRAGYHFTTNDGISRPRWMVSWRNSVRNA